MINFGHVFASFFQKVVAVAQKALVEAKALEQKAVANIPAVQAGIQTVENAAPEIEAVTAAIPTYGALALPFENVLFALMGEFAKVLAAGGDAAAKYFADAGMDIKVIQTVQEVVKTEAPQIAALVAAK